MENFGPPEKVYAEDEWYDGPRSGVADINGLPHRFKSLFDEADDEYLGSFLVWPIDNVSLQLEIEQWHIFVAWNALFEAGKETVDSHPASGVSNSRWAEIDNLLKDSREIVPENAIKTKAEIEHINRACRYTPDGPAYYLKWCLS